MTKGEAVRCIKEKRVDISATQRLMESTWYTFQSVENGRNLVRVNLKE